VGPLDAWNVLADVSLAGMGGASGREGGPCHGDAPQKGIGCNYHFEKVTF
jgi:hypothetical protein